MDFVMDTLLRSLAELIPYTCARVLIPEGGPHVLALSGEQSLALEQVKTSEGFPLTLNADESPFLQGLLANHKSVLLSDTRHSRQALGVLSRDMAICARGSPFRW